MKYLKFIIVSLLMTIFVSCGKSDVKRNKIVFKDNIMSVQDSLFKISNILYKLPKRSDNKNLNYSIKNEELFINDTSMVNYFSKYQQHSTPLNVRQKQSFITISKFLERNYITSAYYDEAGGIWRFIYSDFPELTYDDSRTVWVLDHAKLKLIRYTDTILDIKYNLYLLAPKDAKIYP